MNKFKLAFIAVAILAGVGGAFATKPCVQCENATQYWYDGSNYWEAGEYGVDFDCYVAANICTYYRPDPMRPDYYEHCRLGDYTPIQ